MRSQKHAKDSERKFVNKVFEENLGFAQRIAGSGCGKYGVCDVIHAQNGEVFLVEVKSTEKEVLKLSAQEIINIEKMINQAEKNPPLKAKLVIHWKRRGWQEVILNKEFRDLFPLFLV